MLLDVPPLELPVTPPHEAMTSSGEHSDEALASPMATSALAVMAQRRRERHALAARRCRRKKKRLVEAMQDQVQQLEAQLERQLLVFSKQGTSEKDRDGDAGRACPKGKSLALAYVAEVQRTGELVRERTLLREALNERLKLVELVHLGLSKLSDTEDPIAAMMSSKAAKAIEDDPMVAGKRGRWMAFVNDEAPFFFEEYSAQQCANEVADAQLSTWQLRLAYREHRFNAGDSTCFGWRFQRSLERQPDQQLTLRFHLTKRVTRKGVTIEQLQNETWRIFNTSQLYAALYCTTVLAKVVQRIDEHSVVVLRNSPNIQRNLSVRYVTVKTRMNFVDDQGHSCATVAGKIVPPLEATRATMQPLDETQRVLWMQHGFLHLTFKKVEATPDDGEHIVVEFGGYVKCINPDQAHYLMVELGGILVRWEMLVLPQRLLPENTDS